MSIAIGLIDSGINPWHSHVLGVEGGVSFYQSPDGRVVEGADFRDAIGHGTALAGIIRERLPRAKIYAIKIFHQRLEAPASLLCTALEWAMQKRLKVVNLSLGTEREEDREKLLALCREASKHDIVIVAAAKGPEHRVYPSVFRTVLGVYWNPACGRDDLIFHPGNEIEFGTYGRPRDLPGMPPERNLSGSSFAAAYVSAQAGELLEGNPSAGVLWVKAMLAKAARKEGCGDSIPGGAK
jgi:hypothetical protein